MSFKENDYSFKQIFLYFVTIHFLLYSIKLNQRWYIARLLLHISVDFNKSSELLNRQMANNKIPYRRDSIRNMRGNIFRRGSETCRIALALKSFATQKSIKTHPPIDSERVDSATANTTHGRIVTDITLPCTRTHAPRYALRHSTFNTANMCRFYYILMVTTHLNTILFTKYKNFWSKNWFDQQTYFQQIIIN